MNLANLTTLFTTPIGSAANTQSVGFRSSNISTFQNFEISKPQDNFVSNPLLSSFDDATTIKNIAKSNPRIMQLLKENGLKLNVNMKEFAELKKGHLSDTRIIAAKIGSNIANPALKKMVRMQDIQQAAMLHDYGKILIPKEVLNKNGPLTPEERKIMELHSEFGYELLKQQGISNSVLNLVKYHHQKPDENGYPDITNDYEYNINAQILHAADMYSALTEDRVYHKAYTKENALDIIHKEVDAGVISQEVFDALKKSI